MRSYEAARTLFGFLAFCAWSVVVIGLISAMVTGTAVSQYAGSSAGFAAAIPGIGLAITGLLLLAFVQMGRASVDTAEYTQQMLKISRDQLEVSRQVLNQGNSSTSGFAGTIKKQNRVYAIQCMLGRTRQLISLMPTIPILKGKSNIMDLRFGTWETVFRLIANLSNALNMPKITLIIFWCLKEIKLSQKNSTINPHPHPQPLWVYRMCIHPRT